MALRQASTFLVASARAAAAPRAMATFQGAKAPKKCPLCNVEVDYKNVQMLSQFVSSDTGMILSAATTGACAKKQRQISKAIKRARAFGLMPHTNKDPKFMSDPIMA